jgi:DNA recombination protein RmuC
MLDRARKQIQTADQTLEEIVGRRTRAINRTLRTVVELNAAEEPLLLESSAGDEED